MEIQGYKNVLNFVRNFINEHGFSPSIREIGAGVGVNSTSQVDFYLKGLEEDGKIRRTRLVARSIVLI